MKKTILPALAMLIISAVMLSTASYAWFALSTEVYADNMSVKVKTDSAYLVISKNNTDLLGEGYKEIDVDFENPQKAIYPVAYDYAKVTDYKQFSANNTWYKNISKDPAKTDTGNAPTPLDIEAVKKDYVLLSTVYIAAAKGSDSMSDLKAKVVHTGDEAINVLVVATSGAGDNETGKFERFTVGNGSYGISLADVVNDTTPIKVDIYVFYDGTHETVTTNNLAGIIPTNVTVYFTATSGSN